MSEKTVLKIEFDTPEQADDFASWLCGGGEQDYWMAMECQDKDMVDFTYHTDKQWLKDFTIRTETMEKED